MDKLKNLTREDKMDDKLKDLAKDNKTEDKVEDKFKDLTTEEDTKILFRGQMKFRDEDIIYEKWYWDGIFAESIIFLSEDVEKFDNISLEAYVRSSPIIHKGSGVTFTRGEKFTFVNFNFVISD